MKFKIDAIKIEDLVQLYEQDKLDLTPPYQRNEIWSMKSQQLLIDSINHNFPLPNFFIRLKPKGIWEMVDGQQRSRAIVGFYKNNFPDGKKEYYNKNKFPNFLSYQLAIVFISDLNKDETIEEFYVRVNSSGLKLNRPELKKAEYFNTRFLALLNELATYEKFVDMDLFSDSALNRMNDIDFISELIAQLKYGITEKKDYVDEMFETDISKSEYDSFKIKFNKVIDIIGEFNGIFPIKKTRYKQRNDFYTLFFFIYNNISLHSKTLNYFYKLLALIGEDISPSNEDCEPFMTYALNCVSQSNSKQARINRNIFFNELLLNKSTTINKVQKDIIEYYKMNVKDVTKIESVTIININKLQRIVSIPRVVEETE